MLDQNNVAVIFEQIFKILHLRNSFLKISLNQFLLQGDLSCVSGASFIKIFQVSDCGEESEIHLDLTLS